MEQTVINRLVFVALSSVHQHLSEVLTGQSVPGQRGGNKTQSWGRK